MHYSPCYSKPSSDDGSSRRRSNKRGLNIFGRLFGAPKFRSTGRLFIGRPENFKHNFHVSADDIFPAGAVQSTPYPVLPKTQPGKGAVSKESRKFKEKSTSRAKPANRRRFWTLFKKVDRAHDSLGSPKGPKHKKSALKIGPPTNFRHLTHFGVGEQFSTLPASSLVAPSDSGSDGRTIQCVPRSSADPGVAVAYQVPQGKAPAVPSSTLKPLPPIQDVNPPSGFSSSNQLIRVRSTSFRKAVPYHLLDELDRFNEPSATPVLQAVAI